MIFPLIILSATPILPYEIIDKGYSAPFTGVLLNEKELMKYYDTQNKLLDTQLQLKTSRIELENNKIFCKEQIKKERQLFYYTSGGLITGMGIIILLLKILPRSP